MNAMTRVLRLYAAALAGCMLVSCSPQDDAAPDAADAAATPAGDMSPAAGAAPSDFDRTLELHGVTFRVTSPNSGSINRVTVRPAGLEIDNSPLIAEVDGTVTDAEIADLNADGSPEVYIYVTSAGSGSYGSLLAYGANNKKSLSAIHLPPVSENPDVSSGYMGHDEFEVVDNRLVQRFPVYNDTDTNAEPTGGMRQLEYRLTRGEAGWILAVDRVAGY
jgi:hypothetical protein